MNVFRFGEAKDKGGHLKITGNAVEVTDPDQIAYLRELFDAADDGFVARTYAPTEAAQIASKGIADVAATTGGSQALLETLVSMRSCALKADPQHEFGVSLKAWRVPD